ncbi:hypothetical protein K2X30_12790 [bacterium]|nr:hypothetical protein [bacterium]
MAGRWSGSGTQELLGGVQRIELHLTIGVSASELNIEYALDKGNLTDTGSLKYLISDSRILDQAGKVQVGVVKAENLYISNTRFGDISVSLEGGRMSWSSSHEQFDNKIKATLTKH